MYTLRFITPSAATVTSPELCHFVATLWSLVTWSHAEARGTESSAWNHRSGSQTPSAVAQDSDRVSCNVGDDIGKSVQKALFRLGTTAQHHRAYPQVRKET